MKKFIFGLRYGNWQTRLYVISIPACILLGIGVIIVSFIVNSMVLFLVGVGLGIGAIVLNHNVTIEEVESERQEPKTVEQKKSKESKQKETKESEQKEPKVEKQKESEERKQKEPKQKETRRTETEKEKASDSEIVQNPAEKKEELVSYDEKKMKQVFYKYKVRKDHKTIIIDGWEEKNVHQCPTYVWVHRGQVHFLLMEKGVRELTVPIAKAGTLKYHKGVICQAKDEYLQFRKESLLSVAFSPYLPIYHEGNKNGRPVVYKNLLELGTGIYITNTSAKTIMDMLQPEFQVDDIVTRDLRYNDFFKEIYKAGILFREQIISAKEYQERVNDILQNLALSEASQKEYEATLQALYQNKLITEEYIPYYQQYRERLQAEKNGTRTGKKSGKRKLSNKR